MKKEKRKVTKTDIRRFAISFAVIAVLIITVSFLGNNAFTNAIVKINSAHVEELALHDIEIINSSISQRLDMLEKISDDIIYWNRKDGTSVVDVLRSNSTFIPGADKIMLVSEDGTVCFGNSVIEKRDDILAICTDNGSRFVQRFDNTFDIIADTHREYIVYGVETKPIKANGHTYNYLCCFIKPSELENELKMDSYNGHGFSSVIDGEGNYILNLNRSHSFMTRDKFFADFSEILNYASIDEFRSELSGAENPVTARANAKINGGESKEYYLFFTPMESVDWFFVSAVPSDVLDRQTDSLMRIAGILLGIVADAMLIVFIFSIRSRSQQAKLSEKEKTDALNAKLQEQQEALEKALSLAQSANRAKTTFLNNMSHDIRTPMNAIIGYTGLASSHIDNKEQVMDYISKIAQSSEHLLSLINDVLDMSRIESGKVSIEESEEDLAEILHTLRNIVQSDINNKQLDFFIDSDINNQFVMCDKLRLNQVLLNILSNSIKYTQSGGMVSLRLKEKGITESGYGKYEFRIKDNGMGMSEEFLKTIFEPFTRVKSSTVSGIQGTGLGMAITKNIIDMMGGTIEIFSKEGEGTETVINFEFKLTSGNGEQIDLPELKGLKSLVVDDDISTCRSVSKMLRDVGMQSEWCASGKEAVIRTEDAVSIGELYKVYIIDWIMPDMNGIETTRKIRQIVGNQAPIIVLSAYDWSDIEEEATEAGVTAFISKPLFKSDLNRVLNKCCGTVSADTAQCKKEYDFTGKRILLVEDNEMNREIASEILEEDGFIIDTAEDGTIAVEKMKSAKPGQYDLILMDIQMPIMNGYDATKAIRALPDPEIANITIIAMTANAFEEDRQNALKSGMNEHLAKPIEVDKLKSVLSDFLNK